MKKSILFYLVICLVILSYPVYASAAQSDDATEIWTRSDLEAIADNPGGRYVLMDHIDLQDAPWVPIAFSGTLDGNGYALYNLRIEEADRQTAVSVDGNNKPYDTVFAALFSRCYGAEIQNLTLLGVDVNLSTDQNTFAAGLVGYAEDTTITNCHVSGSVQLHMTDTMCGVGGLVGFGYGTASGCSVDVTLTLVDGNQEIKCEQFLGGILASGYLDIDSCEVTVRGYASVYGYVHNGGVVGMYYVHTDDRSHSGYVTNCRVDAVIRFFEANPNRRAYCNPVIGEQMHWVLQLDGNVVDHFENGETKDYSTTLLPEMCENPLYDEETQAPGCDSLGHTRFTCTGCGYSYVGRYVGVQHQSGEWELVQVATPAQNGLQQRHCALCEMLLEEQVLIAATACELSHSSLQLEKGESTQLTASLLPTDTTDQSVVFSSSDETVATVDAGGMVTAVGPGSATITCTAADGALVASCGVQVAGGFPLLPVLIIASVVAAGLVVLLCVLLHRRRQKQRARRREARQTTWRRR